MDFTDIAYLQAGTPRQRAAYAALNSLGIFRHLRAFQPLLAGTIPLGIDLPGSDLDIVCCCRNHQAFGELLQKHYGELKGFCLNTTTCQDRLTTIARFTYQGFPVEIFAQNMDSRKQPAFRHMLVEYKILQQQGERFRQQVILLKEAGLSTEAAFARLLQLPGDPYQALLRNI